eukprot:9313573-Pyramimonas_sp.AAC.1
MDLPTSPSPPRGPGGPPPAQCPGPDPIQDENPPSGHKQFCIPCDSWGDFTRVISSLGPLVRLSHQ